MILALFTKVALTLHNKFRSLHGTAPLKLSQNIQTEAQMLAQMAAKIGKLEPSSGEEGENLAMKCSDKEMTADEAVIHW